MKKMDDIYLFLEQNSLYWKKGRTDKTERPNP